MSHVVILSPNNGWEKFNVIGPFNNFEQASHWCERESVERFAEIVPIVQSGVALVLKREAEAVLAKKR
jgi:hypothetical protein